MKRSSNLKLSEIRVGLIVGISFLLGALAIVTYGKVQNLFSRQVPLTILFDNVRGLTVGAPVRISGMNSGFVKSIHFVRFHNQQVIQVRIRLAASRLRDLSEETSAVIRTQGLMGIKFLELIPGDLTKGPLNPGLPIYGKATLTMETVLGKGSDLVKNLEGLTVSVRNLMDQVRAGQGTVGRFMTRPDLYDNLDQATREIRSVASEVNHGSGPVSSLIHSREMTRRLNDILQHLDGVMAALDDPRGSLGMLARDPATASDLRRSIHAMSGILKNLESGKGTAGQLLVDPAMGRKMDATLDRVNALLDDMKKDPHRYFSVQVHVF
ncbi:MAG: MlaD family protein [Nitrospirae bacterium]|jgi:phospholipid/cholesterol/gamma-HCH transport system substrate-binding protein|nr:MlaD family protein [Nitrospirota bacterium]